MDGGKFNINTSSLLKGLHINSGSVLSDGPRIEASVKRLMELEGLTELNDLQIVMLCTMVVIVDNETKWSFTRELDYIPTVKQRYNYIYKVYKYQENKQLGNGPRVLKLGENDNSYRFRGSFFPQLTGKGNFQMISDNILDDINDVRKRSLSVVALPRSYKVVDMTNSDIDVAVRIFDFNYIVTRCYYRLRTGLTLHSSVQMTVGELARRLIVSNGYPSKRKYWAKGGFTPSQSDMIARVGKLLLHLNQLN